jgi:preprotein translocase subunit SecE
MSESKNLDKLKWLVTFALVVAALAFFYYFADQILIVRIIGLLVLSGLAVFIAATTTKGKIFIGFARESHQEVRKVVWPTRQETIKTTGIVLLMVMIVAIFIWILDSALFWIVGMLTGRG